MRCMYTVMKGYACMLMSSDTVVAIVKHEILSLLHALCSTCNLADACC